MNAVEKYRKNMYEKEAETSITALHISKRDLFSSCEIDFPNMLLYNTIGETILQKDDSGFVNPSPPRFFRN